MNRFSNINWAAFLLGGMWGSYNGFKKWLFLWIPLYLAVAYAFFADFFLVALLGYCFMAAITVYLTLQGNRMLSNEVLSMELRAGVEDKKRMRIAARQRKLAMYGVWSRLYYMYFLLGGISSMPVSESQGSFDYMVILHTALTLLAIDALSLIAVIFLSQMRGDKRNALYSGDGITAELIADTPMEYKPKSKNKGKFLPKRKVL